MAQEKATNPGGYDFPLNTRLLEEALKLKEERRILKERLSKIEASRKDVSPTVFEKVSGDYANRLQNVTNQLLEKKQELDRELATLYETRDKIQANLKNHKETLEELHFRQKLGEFSKEEFQNQAKAEEDKVARFEQVFKSVQTNIVRYESVFEGEEDLFGMKEGEAPPRLEKEVDEWEEEAMEAGKKQALGTEEWMDATKPGLKKAQITIIAGHDNVGKTYPITNTLTIGRSHTNQIILKDAKSSRQHAEVRPQGNECVLVDLNSSNGTLVNGQRVHEHILAPNDEIQIGDFILQFQQ